MNVVGTPIENKSFLATLFDFEFKSFITLRFLKVIYAIALGLVLLSGFLFLVSALSNGGAFAVLGLILVPLVTLFYLVLIRISMEALAMFFRIGEHTGNIAVALGAAQPPPGYGYGYPGSPQPGWPPAGTGPQPPPQGFGASPAGQPTPPPPPPQQWPDPNQRPGNQSF